MARKLEEWEITRAICNRIMEAWKFNYWRRREWVIYGAKHRVCQTCSSPPYHACLNMVDVKKKIELPRINKQPHEDRVDWDYILEGLKTRGYYRTAIEREVRQQVKNRG